MNRIPFNKPYLTGEEITFVQDAFNRGKFSGNGYYTKKCQSYFEDKYGFKKCFLTTSCTDALEMCAILLDIQPGDEVVVPSFTFVSTANAFLLRGAVLKFADSQKQNPNVSIEEIERLVTNKTKAIVVVHYAGIACDIGAIREIADKKGIYLVEDAAQAIDSYYNSTPLGSIGHLSTFSFHETKNISSGEGGMLAINDERFTERAEIIWEKGTNRAAFWRGEVDKYNWVDIGSSFLPSEITASYLWAQLEQLKNIQERRTDIWSRYYEGLADLEKSGKIRRPQVPKYGSQNGHLFYLVCKSLEERDELIRFLRENQVTAVFHYISLHNSPFFQSFYSGNELPNSINFSNLLLRLPLYFELSNGQQDFIISKIKDYYLNKIDL